ncbi:hypothetical protein [Ensifer sp. 4252]|uniref:hypothetical protein n=1 Tax=Ensifer sp. 4252 TaxID=3373915 RepID=UPI003D2232CB
MSNYDFDVVVLAARHEFEYKPIKKAIFSGETHGSFPLWSGEVTIGDMEGPSGRKLKGALICVGEMGMATTASVAASAITVFRPKLISMIGMCCGFSDEKCASPRKLMDVIVVREVSCWEEGKYIEPGEESGSEFRNRSKTRLVNDAIRDAVDLVIETADVSLTPRLQKLAKKTGFRKVLASLEKGTAREVPDVKFSAFVSGSSVIADEGMVKEILDRHPSAIGLDMEIYGLYAAVDRCVGAKPSVLGVKAVADFGSKKKDNRAQETASVVATEVFKGILERIPIF